MKKGSIVGRMTFTYVLALFESVTQRNMSFLVCKSRMVLILSFSNIRRDDAGSIALCGSSFLRNTLKSMIVTERKKSLSDNV